MKTLDPFKVKWCIAEAEEMINHNNRAFNNFIIVISEENIKIFKISTQSIRDKFCAKPPFKNQRKKT
jgi:hypothetical protein